MQQGAASNSQSSTVLSKTDPAEVATPRQFDIRRNDSSADTGVESMCVVGQSPGEKRKQEHLEDAQRISQREAAERAILDTVTAEEPVPIQPIADEAASIEIDAEGSKATPTPLCTVPAQKS